MAEIWIVLVGLCPMEGLLVADQLRPGFILFWAVCAVVSGKWRRVAERCAGMLGQTAAVRKIRIAVHRGHMRIQPSIASTSAFLSNTVVVVLDRIRLGKMGTSSRFLSVFAIFLRSRAT